MPIIILILSIYSIFSIPAIVTNLEAYPCYKLTYDLLTSARYELIIDDDNGSFARFSGQTDIEKGIYGDKDILIFYNGSIKLAKLPYDNQRYIHSGLFWFLTDPYTWYWQRKITSWYNENLKILRERKVVWHKI